MSYKICLNQDPVAGLFLDFNEMGITESGTFYVGNSDNKPALVGSIGSGGGTYPFPGARCLKLLQNQK